MSKIIAGVDTLMIAMEDVIKREKIKTKKGEFVAKNQSVP